MKRARHGKRPKREFAEINGYLVFERRAYFSDWLENEVGARWYMIKRSFYDAGLTNVALNEYRDGLIEDFKGLCRTHGFTPYI